MLPNFCHLTASTIYFEPRDNIMLLTLQSRIMTSQHLFRNIFILRRSEVTNFGDIIKIVTTFIKKTFKDSKKVKRIRKGFIKKGFQMHELTKVSHDHEVASQFNYCCVIVEVLIIKSNTSMKGPLVQFTKISNQFFSFACEG